MAYYKQIAASNQVKIGFGKLYGIMVTTASGSPTIAVYDTPDGDTGDPKIADTFTPVAPNTYLLNMVGISFSKGLYIAIADTVKAPVVYE